jgi:glycosyltransferase involved in cell wall biosynthesis
VARRIVSSVAIVLTGLAIRPSMLVRSGSRRARSLIKSAGVVELQWTSALTLIPTVRQLNSSALVVGYFHEVANDPYRRIVNGSSPRAIALRRIYKSERAAEIKLLNALDLAVVLSDKDGHLLEHLGFQGEVFVVHPPIEVAGVVSELHPGEVVTFAAHFGRPENADGARWLIDEVWPFVLSAMPNSVLKIVGAKPPRWLLRRESPNVLITGWVPNLNTYLSESRVVAVPLQSGAGVKFKILEAMAHHVPVVSTVVGADGIAQVVGEDSFVAITDDPKEFASSIIRVVGDDAQWLDISSRAHSAILEHYDFGATVASLAERYRVGRRGT